MRSWPRPARRRAATTLLAAAVAMSVAACGSSSSGGGEETTPTVAPATTAAQTATHSSSSSAATHTSSSSAGASSATAGLQVFTSAGCGSCHTLAAAHASGNVGPDLDELKPSEALVVTQVTDGGAAMPSFANRLSKAQIQAVAKFVASAAG